MKTADKKVSIKIGKQLAIFLRDEPGELAKVCASLSDKGITIDALATESGGFFGHRQGETLVRMVVNDTQKALEALDEIREVAVETEVLMIETQNQPGALAEISQCLSHAGINIESIYVSGSSRAKSVVILRPSNVEKAKRVLSDL